MILNSKTLQILLKIGYEKVFVLKKAIKISKCRNLEIRDFLMTSSAILLSPKWSKTKIRAVNYAFDGNYLES